MSKRLGSALAEHIRRLGGESRFVLVEGVPAELAEGMMQAWDPSLPPLAVASPQPERFGDRALQGASATSLRNQHPKGLVLVLCEGQQVPDRQSLNLFQNVAPGDLLDQPEGLAILAQQQPETQLNGPVRAVREALSRAGAAARPSAVAVSDYFDALGRGGDPLRSLPLLGAFADTAQAGRVDAERVADNLHLGSRRRAEDLLRPNALADIRARAKRVLGRRPGLQGRAEEAAEDVMRLLLAGSNEILSMLQYDEAQEIFERKTEDFTATVLGELRDYRQAYERTGDGDAPVEERRGASLPWGHYEGLAVLLRRGGEQKEAATELLAFDAGQGRLVFSAAVRKKLERLLRDKSIPASRHSCPEAAIVKASLRLGGQITRIDVLEPHPPAEGARANRTSASKTLTLACARLRLGWMLRRMQQAGCIVDGLLLEPADFQADEATFRDADVGGQNHLALLQLRLHAKDGSTIQVDWRPDLDDVALLRAILVLAGEGPALTLRLPGEPTLARFCQGDAAPVHEEPPDSVRPTSQLLHRYVRLWLQSGLDPVTLRAWVAAWLAACNAEEATGNSRAAQALALAGAVKGDKGATALTGLAPLKAEWVAQYMEALWQLLERAERGDPRDEPVELAADGIARLTAASLPAYVRLRAHTNPSVPTAEGRLWGLYGGTSSGDESGTAGAALEGVLTKLLKLQPEAAGHLRCIAYGPGAADLVISQAVQLIGRKVGRGTVEKVEVFCVGRDPHSRPQWETLAGADDTLRGARDVLEVRYLESLQDAKQALAIPGSGTPAVHLALITGISQRPQGLHIESPEVAPPTHDEEVLFAPRVWQRARSPRRTLLAPPAATEAGLMWLRLLNAVDGLWPEGDTLRVAEVQTGATHLTDELRLVHDLALWVATLDRYATRDSLELAFEADEIAILHQERRLGGESPLSLVLSQKSGGPADRAIGRSLRSARIVSDPNVAMAIGTDIRRVASQGYGILALNAATTGAGINELVGHVVAFSMLATAATPWPLPAGCRVLLLSLDQYLQWFPSGKRADLLAIALDPENAGVHIAAIEVKARRSDEQDAAAGALDQLIQTLAVTRWAAYPEQQSLYSRMWLNRIAEAAYSVARESQFNLDARELAALESFRHGSGTLEWAGLGLVFGPHVEEINRAHPQPVAGDMVPVVIKSVRLTEELLRRATGIRLASLRTVEAENPPLVEGGRIRRRPEAGAAGNGHRPRVPRDETTATLDSPPDPPAPEEALSSPRQPAAPQELPVVGELQQSPGQQADREHPHVPGGDAPPTDVAPELGEFRAPLLGWDVATGEDVRWHPAGPGQDVLRNGHVEIWGSSGMGKTQFTMSLLAQLAQHSGSRFGIADFKNDYSDDTGFPALSGAQFLDLWNDGAPFNPLALHDDSVRAADSAVIELRDAVDVATQSFTRMGHRQRAKLQAALQRAYELGRMERAWPTLRTLDDLLDEDLAGVLGDLTRNELFRQGPPLGDVINHNVVFGLSKIPGNGQTTVLAAGFILSALLLRVQSLPPVPNTVRYLVVVDEAHRVASFKAIDTMIREGRSKGLAVLLATQQPGDLPEVVATNAQTRICFRLPDATVATVAARKLNPNDPRLPEQIRTLGVGEALVSLGGGAPRLMSMAQSYRDHARLGLAPVASGT